ncbi:MAG: HTH-type transcriptional activator IlvY [Gammaproteobacteria bacterium]|nr:HTH-type transcriptional activator IlvY [Gammaproteobacteria bacterium]
MDHRQMQQFVTLTETLHFGRASELSHLSVSAFSRGIRQLEENLGVLLFLRDNRSVKLTHEGELFLVYAREALGDWETIRSTLLEEAEDLHGEVSIYCSVTASYSFLFDLLSEFRTDFPRVEIKLHTGDPEYALSRVQSGTEDIAIGARPERLPPEVAFKSIAESPLVFITSVAGEFSSLSQQKSTAENWQGVPMILSETGLSRRRVESWFRKLGIEPSIYAQVTGNEAIVSMVSLGFGVGVVPQIVLDNSPLVDKVRILEVEPKLKAYEVGLFARQRQLKGPLLRAFWHKVA